jgi:hypothetical protein
MTGVSKNTVTRLLVDLGRICSGFQGRTLRNLQCQRLPLDEIWSFCYAKAKNVPEEKQGKFGYGDVWTWTAIDADTKLVPSWLVGSRDAGCAAAFVDDLAKRGWRIACNSRRTVTAPTSMPSTPPLGGRLITRCW